MFDSGGSISSTKDTSASQNRSRIVNRKSIRLPTKAADNPNRVAGILPARIVGVSPAVLSFDLFPPQSRIALAFVNPPDILRAVFRLAYKVPAGVEECACRLHLSGSLTDDSF